MVGFADGDGDILLATNIIESGLDVPRANTMIVWRPDRFGLAQLHQLRGRVGRGRVQGIAYLLADPQDDLSDATRARLSTLEAFDRLGSGLAISARDLDLRGGGDLVGEDQAGHVRMIGAALYQRLLERAVRVARGEVEAGEWTPDICWATPARSLATTSRRRHPDRPLWPSGAPGDPGRDRRLRGRAGGPVRNHPRAARNPGRPSPPAEPGEDGRGPAGPGGPQGRRPDLDARHRRGRGEGAVAMGERGFLGRGPDIGDDPHRRRRRAPRSGRAAAAGALPLGSPR
jgi:hypothetical protein